MVDTFVIQAAPVTTKHLPIQTNACRRQRPNLSLDLQEGFDVEDGAMVRGSKARGSLAVSSCADQTPRLAEAGAQRDIGAASSYPVFGRQRSEPLAVHPRKMAGIGKTAFGADLDNQQAGLPQQRLGFCQAQRRVMLADRDAKVFCEQPFELTN
jgi:hypothetical protein